MVLLGCSVVFWMVAKVFWVVVRCLLKCSGWLLWCSNAVVLNSSPRDPLLCTFCMSLLSDTLSSVHRVYPNKLRI